MVTVPEDRPRTERRYGDRPIRLYDSKTKACLAHRCYKFPHRALNAAAALMNWQPVGTLEVYNSKTGRLLGSYTKKPDGNVKVYIDDKIRGKA